MITDLCFLHTKQMDVIKLISSTLPSILTLLSIALVVKILNAVWFRPRKLERLLRKQGVHGNKYRFLFGDLKDVVDAMETEQFKPIEFSDDLPTHIFSYSKHIMNKYGNRSFVWLGPLPTLNICEPELIKEILAKPDVYRKPSVTPIFDTVVGGLFFLEGEKWTKHRKIINPAFHMEKLKSMAPAMLLSCSNMVKKWGALVSSTGGGNSEEIDVWPYLQNLTVETISRTAFGTSHEEGRRIYDLQNQELNDIFKHLKHSFIPGWRYVPTKANRRLSSTSKEIHSLLRGLINRREKAKKGVAIVNDDDGDLLGALMGSNRKATDQDSVNKNEGSMSIEDIIEECKLFYFAGSETTSNLLVWTMVMLSKHRDWQERARDEVFQVFGTEEPSFNALNKLKTVTMILNEVLRLYPPVPIITRSLTKTVKLGDMILPAGVELTLLIGLLHHDPGTWGDDVSEFKPERFSKGISSALTKNQSSYIPFSAGPRVCVGQNFALTEAKIALSIILRRFSFELSSSYVHAPFLVLSLVPQYGATLVLHTL